MDAIVGTRRDYKKSGLACESRTCKGVRETGWCVQKPFSVEMLAGTSVYF